MDLQSVSLSFDIATAISIIGAAATYIMNARNENKKQSIQVREHERIINLSISEKKYNEIVGEFLTYGNQGKSEEALKTMAKLHTYCHEELRRNLVAYGTNDNLCKLKEIIQALRQANKKVNLKEKFDAVQLANSLVELDMNMLAQLRSLLNDETDEITANLIKDFGIERFGYIPK